MFAEIDGLSVATLFHNNNHFDPANATNGLRQAQ
jgi:hypothetical protein